ncbi:hypothetical protein [Thiolinea disciformis]|uniref:hypothetical protein n=1 Tax=Thiolinea disciformis TaxID=125614 RepID=UPI00037D9F16|nr:hypothetical protein [Thiolinea disciformis]
MTAVYRPNFHPTQSWKNDWNRHSHHGHHAHRGDWGPSFHGFNKDWAYKGHGFDKGRYGYNHGFNAWNRPQFWGANRPQWGRGQDTNIINIINNLSSTAISNSNSTSNVKNFW